MSRQTDSINRVMQQQVTKTFSASVVYQAHPPTTEDGLMRFEKIERKDTLPAMGSDFFFTVKPGQTPEEAWLETQVKRLQKEVDDGIARGMTVAEAQELTDKRTAQMQKLVGREVTNELIPDDRAGLPEGAELPWHKSRFDLAIESLDPAWRLSKPEIDADLNINLKLQRNDHSSLHRLGEAMRLNNVLVDDEQETAHVTLPPDVQTFVVSHDWLKALKSSEGDQDGDWMLPYDSCAFEFRFSGHIVIVLATQSAKDTTPKGNSFVETKTGDWLAVDVVGAVWWDQVRAACIMLEAQIATHQVTRAPTALNAKRIKSGKVPLYSHHVVDLARRHKTVAARDPNAPKGMGTQKRWHLVRSHWRHYSDHKTKIPRHARGNPELGFIDKDYKL